MKSIIEKIKKTFEPLFDPAEKETLEHHASEALEQARKHLPENIKKMSKEELAIEINKLRTPGKWALTRRCAQGLQKSPHVGGNHYPPNQSEKLLAKRRRQIEKGMIQVTVDKPYKSSKPVVKQEVVNEGKG
jgi:hypothetical protein